METKIISIVGEKVVLEKNDLKPYPASNLHYARKKSSAP